MATEILAIPESTLYEVIEVIRRGLAAPTPMPYSISISKETKDYLQEWCKEYKEYAKTHWDPNHSKDLTPL